jgi:hypothetical protein
LLDSIGKLALTKLTPIELVIVKATIVEPTLPEPSAEEVVKSPGKLVITPETNNEPTIKAPAASVQEPVFTPTFNNEQKFATRGRQLMQEINISGDSIELTFYDNAEVDGDSVAIFLNNHLLYEHVRLSDKAYTIRLAVATLQQSNELVMVAENLGSIPPNTSLMVAMVDGKRYETRLESTEQSSAVIRFIRKEPSAN